MKPFNEYCNLIIQHDKLIDAPDWWKTRDTLVVRMNRLWDKLSKQERMEIAKLMGQLYQKRVTK